MRPLPSPMPPVHDAHDTAEFLAVNPGEAAFFTKKEKRILKRAIIALAVAVPGLLGVGSWSHYSNRGHADSAVGERMAAYEARRQALEERLDKLEHKVDQMRDDQATDTRLILDEVRKAKR